MDSRASRPKTVDEYLAPLAPKDRKALQAVRRTIRAAAPRAVEVISYGIPGYKHQGNLIAFAAFKNHLTLFAGREVNEQFAAQLKGFEQTKGGIHFTAKKPIPASLVRRIVKYRLAANEAKAKKRRP